MAVSNTTVVLYLLKIGRPDLLKNIFSSVRMPPRVMEELVFDREYEREISFLQQLMKEKYIVVTPVQQEKHFGLDAGENSAISLCMEIKDTIFLSDDKAARQVAAKEGLIVLGTLGIILKNVQKKKTSLKEAKAIIDLLIENGFYVSTELYRDFLNHLKC